MASRAFYLYSKGQEGREEMPPSRTDDSTDKPDPAMAIALGILRISNGIRCYNVTHHMIIMN